MPQQKFYITNINDLKTLENNSCIYALPRTVLYLTVKATNTLVIPGPFHEYAEKYLGIKNVPDSSTSEWVITNIDIGSYNEADPDYYYSVSREKTKAPDKMVRRLAGDSLVLLPDNMFQRHIFYRRGNTFKDSIFYTDLSVKRNIDIKTDTSYREVFRDSVYIKIPVFSKRLVNKSLQEKAEEAANFIIKLRKRRFKLLSGQYDNMPDGNALAAAVEELNNLEDEYLALFTGRKLTESHMRTMYYIPGNTRKESQEILFRFSGDEGFIDNNDVKGKPVIINITDLDRGIGIRHMDNVDQTVARENTYWIRLPDMANIRLIFEKIVIAEADIPVFQFGSLVPYYVNGK